MQAKEMLEKLHDLATYFTLVASDAGKEKEKATEVDPYSPEIGFWEGKEEAYKTAFNKVDGIIKEAKQ